MSRLDIILSALLTFSVILNIGLIIYVRTAILQLLSVSEELGDFQQMVNSFAAHLKAVYELESFYGDEILNGLLQHAISFNEQLETFEYIYSLTEEKNEGNNLIDDNEEEEENALET